MDASGGLGRWKPRRVAGALLRRVRNATRWQAEPSSGSLQSPDAEPFAVSQSPADAEQPPASPKLPDIECFGYPQSLGAELDVETPLNLGTTNIWGRCSVGAFTYFNHSCDVSDSRIGRFCSIGVGVSISPSNHPVDWLSSHPFVSDAKDVSTHLSLSEAYRPLLGARTSRPVSRREVGATIGDDVWVGNRAIILGGVSIGTGAIIGAASVVTRDVPPYTIMAGAPARPVRLRFPEPVVERLLRSEWWRHDLSSLTSRIDYSRVEEALDMIEAAKRDGSLPLLRRPRYRIFGGPPLRIERLDGA